MSIVRTVPEDEATGVIAEIYRPDVADQGFVASHTKVMALRPDALQAAQQLGAAIVAGLGVRRYELATLAAARALGSEHCLLAHGRKSLGIMSADELAAIARDHRAAGLCDADVELMAFAEKLATDAPSMTDDDSRRLREAGFSDEEIVSVALAAGFRCFFSKVLQALAVDVDEVTPGLDPELRDALVGHL